MTTYGEMSERRLYRDADRAMLGGVCAGLAEYFGLNLKVTRFLAFIAFLVLNAVALIIFAVSLPVLLGKPADEILSLVLILFFTGLLSLAISLYLYKARKGLAGNG